MRRVFDWFVALFYIYVHKCIYAQVDLASLKNLTTQ